MKGTGDGPAAGLGWGDGHQRVGGKTYGETDIAAVIGNRLWFWWNFQGSHQWHSEEAASAYSRT